MEVKFLSKLKNKFLGNSEVAEEIKQEPTESIFVDDPEAYLKDYYPGRYVFFDGEKTPYELGTPLNYKPDYYGLHYRAWAAFLDTDFVQNAIKKYCLWIVGAGLKLQSTPVERILENGNISIDDLPDFIKDAEANFRLFADLRNSTYNERQNLHMLGAEALKTALLSGDILCINRLDENNNTTIQTIDGVYIQDPIDQKYFDEAKDRGNIIEKGIEKDKKGKHIAFYVLNSDLSYDRVKARSEDGKTIFAWLFYGNKYKANDDRGLSLLAAVMETASKMDRFKSATVGRAEENAKVVYTIEHGKSSDGENPIAQNVLAARSKGATGAPETSPYADDAANKIAQTTEKQVINMPVDAKLNRTGAETDPNYSSFWGVNIEVVYATLGIPPEVAQDKFGGAYSGSRAALKSWEYKIMVDRINLMKMQFYKPYYDFWLHVQILLNRIQAPGYLQAFAAGDFMIYEAYRACRFIGVGVPHIDPVKEVKAVREKLGGKFKDNPLVTNEQAAEELNSGDYETIIQQAEKELEISKSFVESGSNNNNS